jgi:DNA repair protein RecO (recombination protein O)
LQPGCWTPVFPDGNICKQEFDMSQALHKTKGIVLRSIKYGDTSLVVTMLTEAFGIQSYLVNGVRKHTKKGSGRANLFQPAALLDLVVYHNELKNMQRIREFKWLRLCQHIFSDVTKNAVALFMVELLAKCLKQPEANEDLFYFCEDSLIALDESSETVAANLPLFFALHLAGFFGFRIDDQYSSQHPFLDLAEGTFVVERPVHLRYLEGKQALITSEILKVRQPAELSEIRLHAEFRRGLLYAYEDYYSLHIQEFGKMKTLPVLKEILG